VDAEHLVETLDILVANAAESMGAHGLLTLDVRPAEIHQGDLVADLPPGRYVSLDVTDTGHGMDVPTRAHLFEPYFTTKSGKGRGLGLAMAWGFVHQSGGSIWVRTGVGEGTTFRIQLPREAVAATNAAPLQQEPTVFGGLPDETIMVIDDDQGVRTLVREVLERAGYHVVEAVDGLDALESLAHLDVPPALVVTDVMMPRLGGRRFAERYQKRYDGAPVLYMSGFAEDDVEDPWPVSAPFLAKPFTPALLLSSVREVLDRPTPIRDSA
jgi:CheY-like chemotaxis protein